LQESFREGGRVRTRTVEYLGAIEPKVAAQLRATRQKLGRSDIATLVASVRSASAKAIEDGEREASVDAASADPIEQPISPKVTQDPPPPNEQKANAPNLITTGRQPTSKPEPAAFLNWPDDLSGFKVSPTAMAKTQARFADRLQAMGVDPTAMPKVKILYGHPDGMRRNRDGSYTITASRRTQNKRHQLNKTKLWQHTRQALSLAYLDALAEAKPEMHHKLQSELDASHKATKRMLVQHLAGASYALDRLSLSLQLSVWHSVPQNLVKKQSAEEFGQASFATLKDWRSEAAFVLAEAHKSGWDGMAERNTKARRKLKSAVTRAKNQIDQMGTFKRLGARLSGKRRRIIREIMAREDKLRSIDHLEQRQRILRRHFPL